MKTHVDIRQITIADEQIFPDALELLNRTQGRDLFATDYMIKKTTSSDVLMLGAFQEDELVAVAVAEFINNFDWYLPFDSTINKHNGELAGSFSTLCVKESLQGQGIGQALSHRRMEFLKSRNIRFIVGCSWVSGMGHTSDRVFEKMGFRAVKKVDNFFVESSIKKPFDCPGCRIQPCQCSAILYRLDLS
ncbi:MAG: GNAT family N-acetyltransferase [Bdellovibrionota bacterium]